MDYTTFFRQKIQVLFFIIIVMSFETSCNKSKTETTKDNTTKLNNNIPVYNFEALEPLLYTKTNKIQIINFWAMWCAPCVKELPYFQEYANKNPNVEVLLISLDFIKDIETKLKPFLKKKNIKLKVILLDDPDSNTWINKIDPNWSGAIPFTIIFNDNQRVFYERSFEDIEDLENEINKTFNK